jgi:hypothetical protein
VTPSEQREAFSDRFEEYFKRRPQKGVVVDPRACLRSGYVCRHWPRWLETIQDATEDQKDDPITVRIFRHVGLVGGNEAMADALVERLFSPGRPGGRVAGPPQVDERLERQQALIGFMRKQLDDLTAVRKRRIARFRKKKAGGEVSDQTREAYMSMVAEVGQTLMANSQEVERELCGQPNYEALRRAVIRLLRVDNETPDAQLIQTLREEGELH